MWKRLSRTPEIYISLLQSGTKERKNIKIEDLMAILHITSFSVYAFEKKWWIDLILTTNTKLNTLKND